ncbi:MAG TPA: hypothetical protein VFQ24_15140 [Terriglobia bacterium]|nr:hypothetical protein [Terriglobia bacterium]
MVGCSASVKRVIIVVCLLASGLWLTAPAFCQAKTTISDTIHAPDGSLPSGQIVISATSTFTAADGAVVFQGTAATATATVPSGALVAYP